MERDPLFCGLVSVSRSVLCWCSAFWLFTLSGQDGPQSIGLLPFLIGSAVVFLLVRRFLAQERSLLSLIAISVAAGNVLSVVLIWKCSNLRTGTGIFFGLIAVGTTVYLGVRSCMETTTAARSITSMELTTMFLLAFLWFQASVGVSSLYSAPLLAAVLLSLVEICYLRLSNSQNAVGRHHVLLIVAAVLAVIFLLLGLFVAFGAEPLSEGVLYLIHTAIAFGKWLLQQIERFFLWLFSLFPNTPVEEGTISYEIPQFQQAEEAVTEDSPVMAAIMIVATVGLAIYGLVQLLRYLSAKRIGIRKKARGTGSSVQREKLRLFKWLRRLCAHLCANVRFRLRLFAMRGSPQELFYFLCRSGKRLNFRRGVGETPSAFLHRMASLSGDDLRLQEGLKALAAVLDQCLYAPQSDSVFPAETARCIRRQFRRALRQARQKQLKAMVCSAFGRSDTEKSQENLKTTL